MQQIDFLPAEYRQKHAQKRGRSWRLIVMLGLATSVLTAAWSQHQSRCRVEEELEAIVPRYEAAVGQNAELAELQSQLCLAQADAELLTYLRHPWPRTQILAAVLAPLSDDITFEKLHISREATSGSQSAERLSRTERQAEEEKTAKLPPAARDLKLLRGQIDQSRTVVIISGVTTESAALYRYLGELGKTALFAKCELESIESVENDGGTLRFNATLVVRPGYGQPGGPSGPKPGADTSANRQTTHAT